MRLFRFGPRGQERPGAFDRDGVRRDISSLVTDLRGEWLHPAALSRLSALDLTSLPQVSDGERLGPCVAEVGHFLAAGLNFASHAAESQMEAPKEPIIFTKAPSCLSGPDDHIVLPPGSEKTDWEVELAVVIGRRAFQVDAEEAWHYVAGLTGAQDISARDVQMRPAATPQFSLGKSFPGFGPLGPVLVTVDEFADRDDIGVSCSVNGEVMQDSSTAQLIFPIAELVAYLSGILPLLPGDVILTGTPAGVGMGRSPKRFLAPGDVLVTEVSGIGTLRHVCTAG
jgi:2-keto-4-pentenoate hydratase/2-oxohepta-3-ene-1,7-dioic acid hydratase in catechol pathway